MLGIINSFSNRISGIGVERSDERFVDIEHASSNWKNQKVSSKYVLYDKTQ